MVRAKTWKRERANATLHSAQITQMCTAVVVVFVVVVVVLVVVVVVVVVAVAGAGVGVVEHIS